MSNDRIRLGAGAEFDLIRRFLAGAPPAEGESVLVGPGDEDCKTGRVLFDATVELVAERA